MDFILSAFKKFNFYRYKIILVHCDNTTRHNRLRHNRNQLELVNKDMDNWASFLKKQAMNNQVTILDTTLLRANETLEWFKSYLQQIKLHT